MPPYHASESLPSWLDSLSGANNLALIESQPEQRPEGGWFDFLGFFVGTA